MAVHPDPNALLTAPQSAKPSKNGTLTRTSTSYTSHSTFMLPRGAARHYQQQYADMYFSRLALLKPAVERLATEAWSDFALGE